MFTAGEILLIVATAALITSLIAIQGIYARAAAAPADTDKIGSPDDAQTAPPHDEKTAPSTPEQT